MATETQTAPSPPHLTVLTRVASIPLISSSLTTLHTTLSSNTYTRTPYFAAQALTTRAYHISEPLQLRLAPVIERADDFANMAVDAVESRYPYPFKAKTEDVIGRLKKEGEGVVDVASSVIEGRVRKPVRGVVRGVDQSLTPVVDRFEVVVNKFHNKGCDNAAATTTASADAPSQDGNNVDAQKSNGNTFQYQRAYRLSMDLKDHIYVYTGEQIRQVQEHNVLVQRATTTASNISNVLASSYGVASQKVSTLSDTMITELHNIQKSAAQLPAQAQQSLHGLSERVSAVIGEVTTVLKEDAPVGEKLNKLKEAVETRVQPVLKSATATLQGAVMGRRGSNAGGKAEEKPEGDKVNGDANMNGNGTANGNAH